MRRPNAQRSAAYVTAASRADWASPTAHAVDSQPAGVQCRHRDRESLALVPDQPIGVHPGVGEMHLGGRRSAHAHLALGRARGHAFRPSVNHERTDPVRPLPAGTGQQQEEVSDGPVRDPRLVAVHHVGVPVADRRRAHRGRIGAALRLGQAVGAQRSTAEHVGEQPPLLLVGPEGDDTVAGQHVHADPQRDRQPAAGDLLQNLQVDGRGLAGLRRTRSDTAATTARAPPSL